MDTDLKSRNLSPYLRWVKNKIVLNSLPSRLTGTIDNKQAYYFQKLNCIGEMHLSDGQKSVFYLSETTKSFFCSKIKMLMTRTEWVFAFCGKIIDDSVQ